MREIKELLKKKIDQLLEDGTADRVLGWKAGDFCYDVTPFVFEKDSDRAAFRFDGFCGSNQSKYLISETKKEGRVLALLKPCDTYSFNQLIKEHRINREKVYVLGIPCSGMLDIEKIKALGISGIESIEEDGNTLKLRTIYGEKECRRDDVLLERCLCCKGKAHKAYDELLIPEEDAPEVPSADRFSMVKQLEKMTAEERFAFWRGELSKCIRCNACRNVCPACSCLKCVFDNDNSGIASKANSDTFEENMFHIIRAFHVAGRCTDCGECSRVCPQGIPLHLLNRKFIKDIDEFYGEYQAGEDTESRAPLTNFTKEDVEPDIVYEKGGEV